MEEKSKGFSLRQKKSSRRPPISAPQQIPGIPAHFQGIPAGNHSATSIATSLSVGKTERAESGRQRPKRGGHTSDLVKRRYSTRFTNAGDFHQSDAPPVPSLPGGSSKYEQETSQTGPVKRIEVDLTALKDTSLQAERCIVDIGLCFGSQLINKLDATNLLSDASYQELKNYQLKLHKIKNRTSTDLQQNVYQNRTQFIKISQEAEKLKWEMRTLRGLMSELTTSINNTSLTSAAPESRTSLESGVAKSRKQANRSSLANLEAMWNAQLHALWKNVEGSQKFLPAIPGRHVIHETGYWVELDAATWKAKRAAHIFLLNDSLLVATKKKKRVEQNGALNGASAHKPMTKLVADRCWPLQDIDMVDISSSNDPSRPSKDRREMSNAICVRQGRESFTYRFDKPSNAEKDNLLQAFKRAADELRRSLRATGEESSSKIKETMGYITLRDPALSRKPKLVQTISTAKDRPEILIEVDGKHQNLRWVESQIDELDSELALQRFEEAVRHVEKLRKLARGLKGNLLTQELILTKVDERAGKLAGKLRTKTKYIQTNPSTDLVTQRLINTHSFPRATQRNVAWLVSLGFDDRAREAYLKSRSESIAKRKRQILFEGNLHRHIFEISYIYFTLIRNTVTIFQQCFPPLMMSACVEWAKKHLDDFNNILASQLGNVQRDSPTWRECMDQAREHAKMLDEVGLDFKALVGLEIEETTGDDSETF